MRLTLVRGHAERTVLLDVDHATTAGALAAALDVEPGQLVGASVRRSAGVPLSATTIRHGERLAVDRVHDERAHRLRPGAARLEVVGGPFAGERRALPLGRPVVLGSGREAEIRIADARLASAHARLTALGPGDGLLEAAPGAPVFVNGTRVAAAMRITWRDVIQLGSELLRLGAEPAPEVELSSEPRGMRGFNRPSRIRPESRVAVVALPGARPEADARSPLPWLSALLPVLLGVGLAIGLGRPVMLLMALAAPVMVIGTSSAQRRMARRRGERTESQWVEEVRVAGQRLAGLAEEQRAAAWHAHPDPARIRDIATVPLARLWERRIGDPDDRRCRLGCGVAPLVADFTGERPGARSATRSPAPSGSLPPAARSGAEPEPAEIAPVPIAADLSAGPLGIAGPELAVRSVARAVIVALATLRSPRDLRLVMLCADDAEAEWGWIQWLPHLAPDSDPGREPGPGAPLVRIGNTDDTRRERVRELARLVAERRRAGDAGAGEAGGLDPPPAHTVLLIDGAQALRRLPGMVEVLAHGTAVGVHVIALERDRSRLPEECRSLLLLDHADAAAARFESDSLLVPHVLVDGLSLPASEEAARALCSVEHVSGADDAARLPHALRYRALAPAATSSPAALLERWRGDPLRSLATVGATAESEFAIDLAADGPHALVAGTTGSGKSEFLQTLITALALGAPPNALHVVLIDYKGGAAFAECAHLPHTVGLVTDLDAHETRRALASLDAELSRREHVLGELRARDLAAAWLRDPAAAAERGLTRLVIVVDEFAELKAELPEFVAGLVRIARLGRSLGVHLVLATQRPAGVVSPEMQANISLRIALRVADRADSTDVIGVPDASAIAPGTPGRGILRATGGELPRQFQTARVSGSAPRVTRGAEVRVEEVRWERLGLVAGGRTGRRAGAGDPARAAHAGDRTHAVQAAAHGESDLAGFVALALAASRLGGIERGRSPWLPPLPRRLALERVRDAAAGGEIRAGEIVLGLQDLPTEQAQRPLAWGPLRGGHLLFVGGARSGRTSALISVLGQLVGGSDPARLHLVIVDSGTGALAPVAEAPHVGAVIAPHDHERLNRLMRRLLTELEERQAILAGAGVGSVVEQWEVTRADEAMPIVVLLIDGWERLCAALDPEPLHELRGQLMRVLREGPASGVRVIMTADRTVLGDRIAGAIETMLLLPLRDPNDYRAAGLRSDEVPAELPPGRVLTVPGGTAVQLALLSGDPSGQAQVEALRGAVRRARAQAQSQAQAQPGPVGASARRPLRVDAVPRSIGLQESLLLPPFPGLPNHGLVYGVGGDELSRLTADWAGAAGFVVAGGAGSGRSTLLATLLAQLSNAGHPILVLAPRPSRLTCLAARVGVPVIDSPEAGDALDSTVAALGADPARGCTLIVDDAELLARTPLEQAVSLLPRMTRLAVAVDAEASATLFGGPLLEARRARCGVVLDPRTPAIGTQLFGTPIPRGAIGGLGPGGGLAHVRGRWIPVRIPLPAAE